MRVIAKPVGYTGFSLAELLMVLLIVAQIATFTIPKILVAQQDQRRRAVFRETIGMLNSVTYMIRLKNQASASSNQWSIVKPYINGLKLCDDSQAEGCWPSTRPALPWSQHSHGGFTLPNGAQVVGFCKSGCSNEDEIYVDWNGSAGPNKDALFLHEVDEADTLIIRCVFAGDTAWSEAGYAGFGLRPTAPGTCGPSFNDANKVLYLQIFR